jgi:hypothetical protein
MDYAEVRAMKINETLRELNEHFEAVQILATWVDDDGMTCRASLGVGNWYARQGLAREFLEMDAAATTAHELAKVICEDEDEF